MTRKPRSHVRIFIHRTWAIVIEWPFFPMHRPGGGGVLLGILGGGVPPGSSNPNQISDQKMLVSTPVFRLDL